MYKFSASKTLSSWRWDTWKLKILLYTKMDYSWYWGINSKKQSVKNKKFIKDLLVQIQPHLPNAELISNNITLLTTQFLNLADFFNQLHHIALLTKPYFHRKGVFIY